MVGSTTSNPPDRLRIVPAREEDVDLIIGFQNEAAEWLRSKGFSNRRSKARLVRDKFLLQIRQNEIFLAKLGEETVGTITLSGAKQYSGTEPHQTRDMFTSLL